MNESYSVKLKFFLCFLLLSCEVKAQTPYELLITEIMADPTPSRGLPEKEYLELYNASGGVIKLLDYTLQYGTFETGFPEVELEPDQYVILVRKGNESTLGELGQVVSLSKLSLRNSGTTLRLVKGNSLIHEVLYDDDWYSSGRSQGYSLEMIDLNYPCVGKQNWTSTASDLGGTPGKKNASARTNPDTSPPELLFFDAETPAQILFNFNEKLDPFVTKDKQNYVLSSGATVESVALADNGKDVLLRLTNELPENTLIDITIANATDCSGNVAENILLSVGNLPPADSGEVVLNEVLFNPKLGGGDYIELYNRSENVVSLKNWAFANLNSDGEAESEPITKFNLLLEPRSYLVFTENVSFLSDFYPSYEKRRTIVVDKLPSMRNTDGTVLLLNERGNVFDRFDYDEDLHHPIIDDPDGIALEKISVDRGSNEAQNWQSASADVQFGTPGYENSQKSLGDGTNATVWVEPEIFTPDLDGIEDLAELKFSQYVNGNVATVQVMTVSGVTIKLIAQNKLLGSSGSFVWDGTDESGNQLPVGYYIFVADIFNQDGTTERYKRKLVLGSAI